MVTNSKLELKVIESILHPVPSIRGYKICHKHKGQYIYFNASKTNENNGKVFRVHRSQVLHDKTFYRRYFDDLVWLTK